LFAAAALARVSVEAKATGSSLKVGMKGAT